MNPKRIRLKDYQFLQQVLNEGVLMEKVSQDTANSLLSGYEPNKDFSFIRVLTAIGSLLLGFGVLSFIASNWEDMTRPLKLAVIIGFLIAFNLAGYFNQKKYPKTAAALFYVGALIYGAGIFLVQQMFHLSVNSHFAFFLWATGLVPLMLLRKDVVLNFFTMLLYFIWLITSTLDMNQFPWYGLLITLPYYFVWYTNKEKEQSVLFLSNTFLLFWLFFAAIDLDLHGLWIALFFFALGIFKLYQKHMVLNLHGNLLIGIAGLNLTSPYIWDLAEKGTQYSLPAIGFAVAFGLYLLKRIHSGSLFAIVLICALIIRYYVDLTYDFLPKSLFFILGGLLLLGFGYYFERRRRKGGLKNEL